MNEQRSLPRATIGALGIVYGDITLKYVVLILRAVMLATEIDI